MKIFFTKQYYEIVFNKIRFASERFLFNANSKNESKIKVEEHPEKFGVRWINKLDHLEAHLPSSFHRYAIDKFTCSFITMHFPIVIMQYSSSKKPMRKENRKILTELALLHAFIWFAKSVCFNKIELLIHKKFSLVPYFITFWRVLLLRMLSIKWRKFFE